MAVILQLFPGGLTSLGEYSRQSALDADECGIGCKYHHQPSGCRRHLGLLPSFRAMLVQDNVASIEQSRRSLGEDHIGGSMVDGLVPAGGWIW